MSRPPRSPDWRPLPRATSSPPQLKSISESDQDEWVFKSPQELMCPISHEVFSDPVINVAGQVYERASIEQHLLRHNTDPVSGTRLHAKSLTPVYSLKSRAAEFREDAARHCVEIATAVGSMNAVKYVRRAAELCEALSAPVVGLSKECMEYVKSHPSNIYDTAVMHSFAEGLCKAGQRERAATVYFTLLQAGEDRVQQSELLRKFMMCWCEDASQNVLTDCQEPLERLVELMHHISSPTPVELVKIAQEAELGHSVVGSICERYLNSSKGMAAEEKVNDHREWNRQKQVLLHYLQLCCSEMSLGLQSANERMDQINALGNELRVWLAKEPKEDKPAVVSQAKKAPSRLQVSAAVCLVATTVLRPELVGVRIVKAACMAFLFHARRNG